MVGPPLAGILIAEGWERVAYYSVLALPVLISALAVRYVTYFNEQSRARRRRDRVGSQRGRPASDRLTGEVGGTLHVQRAAAFFPLSLQRIPSTPEPIFYP